jgi:nucleoside 2-deoxyribosyltransferase
MKIYLAGPDIFRPDGQEWIANARELCREHGFEALTPFDHGETEPKKILDGNLELIRKAQIVVANLNPFRGFEPDSGTAFELGYALALGKKLLAYVDSAEPLLERIRRAEALSADAKRDSQGMAIEDFGLPLNLMLALTTQLVEGDLAACIAAIRPRVPSSAQPEMVCNSATG